VFERETEKEKVGSQKEILTKPRYTHKSLSVACLALVFYSYALCWRNKMTAEFLQRKIWCLSCFLRLPSSFLFSVYPSLYYSVTSQFCSLPLVFFCFLFMLALCSLFACFFLLLTFVILIDSHSSFSLPQCVYFLLSVISSICSSGSSVLRLSRLSLPTTEHL